MRKERKKVNTGNKRNNQKKKKKKNAIHVSQTITKSKTVTQGKISLLLTEQADE